MKMFSEIPPEITIPDELDTNISTIKLEGGFPAQETAQRIYHQLDFQRAVEAVMVATPGASVFAFAEAIRTLGLDNKTALLWRRMDSKVQLFTPNTTVVGLFL